MSGAFNGCESCIFNGVHDAPCGNCDDGDLSGKTDREREIESAVVAERSRCMQEAMERCAALCEVVAEEYGRLSAGQSARVDALRHGLSAIAAKARAPAEIIARRALAADDACTEINQSVGYAVARECARRIRGEK